MALRYRDGDTWKAVENATEYGTVRDQYNEVSFKPVTTSGLRLDVQLNEQVSGGILDLRFLDGKIAAARKTRLGIE